MARAGPAIDFKAIAEIFGAKDAPVLLNGGQGGTFRAGAIVIKPADNMEEAAWLAETFNGLGDTAKIRTPKPVLSTNRKWIEDGYVAWSFTEGHIKGGVYREKSEACDAYNRLVGRVAKPGFIDTRIDPWSVADRKAWGEERIDYGPEFAHLYEDMLSSLTDLYIPSQMIHADFSGNVLFADELPPAVIDFSPYWQPADFAQAVILIDAAALDGCATVSELLSVFGSIEHIEQLTLRAALRRIFEQFEHIRMRGADKAEALQVAESYRAAHQRLFG
ncbi:MAG: hypothetical protein ABSA49_02680 [Rhizomicrobium sp.]|jgi:uncharacterized protein (TIGR02569 family)